MTREVDYGDFKIKYVKRKQSRRIKLSIKSDGSILVSLPYFDSFSNAEKFVAQKKLWIISCLQKLSKEIPNTNFDWDYELQTLVGSIAFKKVEANSEISINKEGDNFFVLLPSNFQFIKQRDNLAEIIKTLLKKLGKPYLTDLLNEYAELFQLPYNKVYIKTQKSIWGSCSINNNINLNAFLITLPEELCEYVILHELSHTIHKNHSKSFWQFLDSICPDAIKKDRQLKAYHPML